LAERSTDYSSSRSALSIKVKTAYHSALTAEPAAALRHVKSLLGRSDKHMSLSRFLIERDIPKAGNLDQRQLKEAAVKSNEVLRQLGPDIQWVESYIADDKLFCVYLATSEDIIRKHAQMSGFPATKIIPVKRVIDPTTAQSSVGPVPLGHAL
jgi:hypothetical protein